MNSQFKKGVLDLVVLAMLEKKDRYGFELVSMISTRIDIAERTIYPLLKRFRDDGLVSTYLGESALGPARRYYRLESEGVKALTALRDDWKEFSANVNALLEEAGNDDSAIS